MASSDSLINNYNGINMEINIKQRKEQLTPIVT